MHEIMYVREYVFHHLYSNYMQHLVIVGYTLQMSREI